MKTPFLDEMIKELGGYEGADQSYLSKTGKQKLKEFEAIKEQLELTAVVQAKPEKDVFEKLHSYEGPIPYGKCYKCGKEKWEHDF